MDLSINKNQNIMFHSKLNPIAPFKIHSKWGSIEVREATNLEIKQSKFLNSIAKLLCKNFASLTKDPDWLIYNHCGMQEKKCIEKYMQMYLQRILEKNDKNTTLLIAKDKKNKIRGVSFSYPFYDIPNLQDTTLTIDAIGIDKAFRGIGLGKKMILKTLNASQQSFTDVFLYGENLAKGFYNKLGFKEMNPNDENQKIVINYLKEIRSDYPEYITFFSKELQQSAQRWYDQFANFIKNNTI